MADVLTRTTDETSTARAQTLYAAAQMALYEEDHWAAEDWLNQCLVLWQAAGDRERIATVLNALGVVAWQRGDPEAARRLYKRSLSYYRAAGSLSGVATTVGNIGSLALEVDDDPALAQRCFLQTVRLLESLGSIGGVAHFQRGLGEAAAACSDWLTADRHFDRSRTILHDLGDKNGIALTLLSWAEACQAAGKSEEARRLYRDALPLYVELEQWRKAEHALRRCALLCAEDGCSGPAARLTQAAERILALSAAPLTPHDADQCAQIVADALAAVSASLPSVSAATDGYTGGTPCREKLP